MSEAIETATTAGRPMPRSPSDLVPLDQAAFRIVFFEECEAAGPEAPVTEPFNRAMARVRRFLNNRAVVPDGERPA